MIRRSQSLLNRWAIRVAIWSPAIALLAYFVGGIIPVVGASPVISGYFFDLYSHTCHQLTPRSFLYNHAQLGFCARCTGFYAALALTSWYVVLSSRRRVMSTLTAVILCAPMTLDAIFDLSAPLQLANLVRFGTGVVSGLALVLYIYPRLITAACKLLAPNTRAS